MDFCTASDALMCSYHNQLFIGNHISDIALMLPRRNHGQLASYNSQEGKSMHTCCGQDRSDENRRWWNTCVHPCLLTQRTRLPQKTAGTEQEDFISGWTLTEQRCTAIWIMSELWSSLIYFGLKSDLVYRRYVASLNVDLSAHNELDEIILWTFGVWIRSVRTGLEVKWGTWGCGNKWWGHGLEVMRGRYWGVWGCRKKNEMGA